MRVTPMSEEQIEEQRQMKLLTPGEGDFEIVAATNERSKKSGADMIKLRLKVWDSEGEQSTVFDYLMDAMPHKCRHVAYACGLGHCYEQGDLAAEDFVGKSGRCVIKIKPAKGEYKAGNEIEDYVVADRTKRTDGYQAVKDDGAGAVALKAAKTQAKGEFMRLCESQGVAADMMPTKWKKAFAGYFGQREEASLTILDWNRFRKDGFVRIEDPTDGQEIFDDSSVPF